MKTVCVLVVVLATAAIGRADESDPKNVAKSPLGASLARDLLQILAALGEDGPTLKPLLPRSTIVSASGRLQPDAAAIVMRRLSDPGLIDQLEPIRPEIARVLAGLSSAIPLLREIEPEVQLVIARQSFRDAGDAVPMGKLPGVALVFVPRDPKRAKQIFLSAFWAAMLEANETAQATGRPRLRMTSSRRGEGFFAGATFVPGEGEQYRGLADYNLSPAIGIAGQRFVISSSKELALQLVELADQEDELVFERVPGSLRIEWGPVAGCELVCDNLPSIAELVFDDNAFIRRSVDRFSSNYSQLLAALPHPTWRLPSRPLVPWRIKWRDTAAANPSIQ